MKSIPGQIRGASKVMGYFAYTQERQVFCDGDACIIAGSSEAMKSYLQRTAEGADDYTVKKTRLGEVMEGLKLGGAYAFDQESYTRFYELGRINGLDELPPEEVFSGPPVEMHFIRIQMVG